MANDDEEEENFLWAGGGPLPLGSPGAFSTGGASQGEPERSPVEEVDCEEDDGLTGVEARKARQLRREKSEALRLQRLQQAAAMRRERSQDSLDAPMILDVQEARAKRLAAKLAAKKWAKSTDAGNNVVDDDEADAAADEDMQMTKATFVATKKDSARRQRVALKAAARRTLSGEINGTSGNEAEFPETSPKDNPVSSPREDDDVQPTPVESGELVRAQSTRSSIGSENRVGDENSEDGKKKEKKKDKKEKKAKKLEKLEKEPSRKRSRSWTPPSPRAMAIAKALASNAPYLAQHLQMGGAMPQAGPSITWDPRINAPVADGQAQLPPSQQMAALPAGNSPYAKEVDEFLALGKVDDASAARMRRLPPHLQRAVMDKGPLHFEGSVNPTAVLVSRMRDAELGRILPSAAAPALAAPSQLALPSPGDPLGVNRDPTAAMIQRF